MRMRIAGPSPWPTVEQRLGELQRAVCGRIGALHLWQTLTEEQQRQLGGFSAKAFEEHGRTLGMWIKLSGVTPRNGGYDSAIERRVKYQRSALGTNRRSDGHRIERPLSSRHG